MRLPLILLLVVLPCWPAELRVAVAANFKPTLERINSEFLQHSPHRLLLSSGSTGILYNQISRGAPFDLFLAADTDSVAQLQAAGLGVPGQRFCYALGQLTLLGGELAALADPALSLAMANPVTAPYGRAAREVLARDEFAPGQPRRLVRGANAAQAYQFWHTGSVDLALVPAALARGQGIAIPQDWHSPVEQQALLLRSGIDNPAAAAYLEWLRSDRVHNLIIDAGYRPCP